MRKFKHFILSFILTLLYFNNGICQIAITEIYYDTPYLERTNLSELSHAGEYIELFNYTTEDLDISGWQIFSYTFPQGSVIESGDFILLAWDRREFDSDFLIKLFPSLQGKESKIYYHNDFLLNNYKSEVVLYMTSIVGITFPQKQVMQLVGWEFPKNIEFEHNYVDPLTYSNSSGYNYDYNYYKKSLQLKHQDQFQSIFVLHGSSDFHTAAFREATPMSLDYEVQLIPIENIPKVMDFILNNYDHFIGNSGVLDLLNTMCDQYVATIYENNIEDDIISEECPEYDEAGNFIGFMVTCPFSRKKENNNMVLEMIDYSSMVWVTPNPTRGETTIYWDKDVEDLISEIIVIPLNGGQYIPVISTGVKDSAKVDLSIYPSGIYVVRFVFFSGQIVTKSIIKI